MDGQPAEVLASGVEGTVGLRRAVRGPRITPLRRFVHLPQTAVWGGWLFLASGLLALLNLASPLAPAASGTVFVQLALLDVLLAVAIWMLPWQRWHPRATLVIAPVGYAVIALFEAAGGLMPQGYASFFMLVAVWVGLFHPPAASLWLVPVTALAYALPLLDATPNELRSTLLVVPISVLVAQVVARAVASGEQARRRLSEEATTDTLTGLPNRRYFDAILTQILAAGRGKNQHAATQVAAITFDLDHFRDINNRHGHEAGDAVLRRFARVLRNELRADDLVARVGGEEFTVVLPHRGLDAAVAVAERVRQLVADMPIELPSTEAITVTVSAGCSQLGPSDFTGEQLLRAADVGLAMAKRSGRNRTVAV